LYSKGKIGLLLVGLNPIFFLSIFCCWFNIRLHSEYQLHMMPGRALQLVGGCRVVVGGSGVESEFGDRFGYSLSLAKPNKI
jgi:hypothetical protein